MEHDQLDCRSLSCPMPIVKLLRKVTNLKIGDTLEILSDDPAFSDDIKAWCTQTGNTLIEVTKEKKLTKAIIKKVQP